MAKLEVNVDKYFQEVMKERTELDMNENPEISHIKDVSERKNQAERWFESRINQLKHNESYDDIVLKKARDGGFLEFNNYLKAVNKCHEIYEIIRRLAKGKYEEAISEKAISTSK